MKKKLSPDGAESKNLLTLVPAPPTPPIPTTLAAAAHELKREIALLPKPRGAAFLYNPLEYAWEPHAEYLARFGTGKKKVLFLGMNPGPFGMAQTGVPFGEVDSVRDWLGIGKSNNGSPAAAVGRPSPEHPKRPVLGFACTRSEVSGRRLWGLFRNRFGSPEHFFADHFVANYCPLVFMDEGGRNLTPDKMDAAEMAKIFAICDRHLAQAAQASGAEWVIGIGAFAFARAESALANTRTRLGKILHPSPASPAANRDWPGTATTQLEALGIW